MRGRPQTADPTTVPATEVKRYRMTVRARLALTYSALLTGAGVVLLAVVYAFMRFVPTYDFGAPTDSVASVPSDALDPLVPPTGGPSVPAASTVPASEIVVTSSDQLLNLLLVVSVVLLVILAVVGVAVGWAVAGRMLTPLQHINAAVHRASQGDLEHRIRLTGPRDEISELAENVDEMLDRLDRAFTATQRFAANASHELRTPLATTRAMLDVALAQDPEPGGRVVLERLRMMNERSIETVTALLRLAEIDATPPHLEPVNTRHLVSQVIDSCSAEALAHDVRIERDLTDVELECDPVLLRQLVANLVQNAIRHNVPGGHLSVSTRAPAPGALTIRITNSGPVLDPAVVAGLTEPFGRAAGRTRGPVTGHGLGLSIVEAIVDRFHGDLSLAARPGGGLTAVVTLAPAHPASPETTGRPESSRRPVV